MTGISGMDLSSLEMARAHLIQVLPAFDEDESTF
jgi:hypothetical protein